jgi:hypothetical protein
MEKSNDESIKKKPKVVDCSKCKYKCTKNFTEEVREKICESFWALNDYCRQKDFILANVKSLDVKRRRPTKESSTIKRSNSKKFSLMNKKCCQKFFLKTLNISNGPLLIAFSHKNQYTNVFDSTDCRGKHTPSNKLKKETVALIVEFLSQKSTTDGLKYKKKVICDPNFRSLRALHTNYKELNGSNNVSYTTFKRIFYEHNFTMPQERLRYNHQQKSSEINSNDRKIEIESVEVLNFNDIPQQQEEIEVTQKESEIIVEEQQQQEFSNELLNQHATPNVIVNQINGIPNFLAPPQVPIYEIQFIHLPSSINTL